MDKAIGVLGEYKARIFHNHIGPRANLLHYPVAESTMVNVTAFVHDPDDWPAGKPTTLMGSRDDVRAAFRDWNPAVRDLVDLFPDQLHMWAVFDLWEYPLPFYNRGRVCLAGDAAHATSPHHGAGAGMGIEDALCLSVLMGEVLASTRRDRATRGAALATAFDVYDKVRRTRSQWLVNSSRRMCDLHHQDDWANPAKWLKAETCFEEVKDRSHKIWYYDIAGMVMDTIETFGKASAAQARARERERERERAHATANGARADGQAQDAVLTKDVSAMDVSAKDVPAVDVLAKDESINSLAINSLVAAVSEIRVDS